MIQLDKKLQESTVILNEMWTTTATMPTDRVPFNLDGTEILTVIMYPQSTINALTVYVDLVVRYLLRV
ncbi:hypothetical protein LCGC14_2054550, partial [marine sediment metagenome]